MSTTAEAAVFCIQMEMEANSKSRSPDINRIITQPKPIIDKLNQLSETFERYNCLEHIIFRVPSFLKVGGDDAFIPRVVSIGPYHFGKPHLQPMQFHKYRLLHFILKKTGKDISQFLDAIKKHEHDARACYEDLPESSFPSDIFVEMLLLDACFVLCFFDSYPKWELNLLNYRISLDPVLSDFLMGNGAYRDMILMENQIPLFILSEIYEVLTGRPHDNKVRDTMFMAFDSSIVIGRNLTSDEGGLSLPEIPNIGHKNDILSCLDVFWHSLMYDSTTKKYTAKISQGKINSKQIKDVREFVIPSVTELKEAGVSFKRKNTTPFWDIEFKGGILNIPQIMIYEMSESIFLNLMAFEVSWFMEEKTRIISYVGFMDSSVNSAPDVAELREYGIIVSAGPSDKEIADLFNRLGKRMFFPFDQFLQYDQFVKTSRQIHHHCEKKRNKWRAHLMHNYFKNPWTIISVITAAVLVILTIVQTYYTIGQYYQNS